MPIQFVSQLAQMRDTWSVIAEAKRSETEAPTQCLALLELAVKSTDKVLNDTCSELDIRITPVEAPRLKSMELSSQMTKEYLTCSKLSAIASYPEA